MEKKARLPMKKMLRFFWLVFLSVFPINDLLKSFEMEDFNGDDEKKAS